MVTKKNLLEIFASLAVPRREILNLLFLPLRFPIEMITDD